MGKCKITGAGEPLLFMHGALVSQAMWTPQAAEFSKAFRVILLDLPAHGSTRDLPGEYTIEALAEFVIRQLNELKIDRVHVCGHSLGGMVAQQLAAAYAERVGKLVLAETAFGTNNSLWERIETVFAKPFLQMTPQNMLVDLSAKRYGTRHLTTGEFIRQEMSRYDHKTSLRVMDAASRYAGKQKLASIQSPTLVLVGEDNKQTHTQGREMTRLIPEAKLVVIGQASHMLNLDNPEAFNREVFAHLTAGRL